MAELLYGGIDAGGTDFKCVVGAGPHSIIAEARIPVTTPPQTLAACGEFFRATQASHGPLVKLGIGSFGPVDLTPDSATYGFITSTPKPGWRNTDVLGYFRRCLGLPTAFDTDVNAALLGEARWGAARQVNNAVYVTIGTGIGAGAMVDGRLLHGRMHPEAGHMLIPAGEADDFAGVCPFHGRCLEGMASGPALARRVGEDPAGLPDEHPVWRLQAYYLAAMCMNYALHYSPERIILGGGVMQRKHLLHQVHLHYNQLMNGYLGDQPSGSALIVPAELGSRAGALGALALAGAQ